MPFLGLAWWALDFPFMKRHSATYLQKHPEARGEDLAATRKACERFALLPTSVMNFVEGTRYTAAKHKASKSPYRHLLRPRPGRRRVRAVGDGRHRCTRCSTSRIAYRGTQPDALGPVLRPARPGAHARAAPADRAVDAPSAITARTPAFRARFKEWLADAVGREGRAARGDAGRAPSRPATRMPRHELGPAVAVHPRAHRRPRRDRRLRPRQQRRLRRLARRLCLGPLDLARHQPGTVPVAESRHGRVAHADQLPARRRSRATAIQVATWPVRNDCKLRIERRFQIRRDVRRRNAAARAAALRLHRPAHGRAKRMPEDFTRYVVLPEVAAAVAAETASPTSRASSPAEPARRPGGKPAMHDNGPVPNSIRCSAPAR